MYLSAAVIPPADLRRALHRLVSTGVDRHEARRVWAGLGPSRGSQATRRSSPSTRISITPPANMMAPLTRFGYVDPIEAERVRDTIAELASSLEPPEVWLSDTPRVDRTQGCLLLELRGEVARLEAMFHAIHAAVRRLGFFQDRRGFDLAVPVVSFAADLHDHDLDPIVAALRLHGSVPWLVPEISLMRQRFVTPGPELEVYRRIPLWNPRVVP